MSTDRTAAIWSAVDRLTKPTTVQIVTRDSHIEPDVYLKADRTGHPTSCDVAAYRAARARHGIIPSLWEQATEATRATETSQRSSATIATRTPADLDLMEIRQTIIEFVRHELRGFGHRLPKEQPFDQLEIRRLASEVIRAQGDLDFAAYRFESWARMLATYLQAVERQAKPIRLRSSACPNCGARQVLTEGSDGPVVVPALVIDFSRDGFVRAATCEACSHTWFRGAQMETLAATLNGAVADDQISA